MVGLLDVCPLPEKVDIGGGVTVDVTGVSGRGISYLLDKFPQVVKILQKSNRDGGDSPPVGLFKKLAPDAIAAIIAAGTGNIGNEKAEAIADNLPLEIQLDLLGAIWRKTFPSGVGPFVERILSLTKTFEELAGKVPELKLPSPPLNSGQSPAQPSGT